MIEIYQTYKDNISAQLSKLDVVDFGISIELIKKDISRLADMRADSVNKYNVKNIDALVKYLKTVIAKLEEDDNGNKVFSTCWTFDNIIPDQYPVKLINEPIYNIDVCNYIELPVDSKLFEVDLTEMCNIIAFEIMYKDFDLPDGTSINNKVIEDRLAGCRIIGSESSDTINALIDECGHNIYAFSKSMVIGNTPYADPDTRMISDYFRKAKFKTKRYRDPVKFSCEYAAHIVMESIIKNSLSNGLEIAPLMIGPTTLAFTLNTQDTDMVEDSIIEDINIRTFGRHFLVKQNVMAF